VISSRNAAFFCNQFATLIASGLPLDRALATLTRSAPSYGLRRIAAGLRRRISQGDTLAQALGAYRAHLPRLMEPLIEVGEHTGRLEDVLGALAGYYDSQWDLKRTTMSHLVPMIFYFAVCGALIVFIRFVRAEWNMAWLQRTVENIAFVVACVVLALLAVKLIPAVQSAIMLVGSALPFVSGIMRQSAISRFALAMQASLGSGLDTRRAITLSAGAMANPMLAGRVRRAAKRIADGLTISEALDRTGVFGAEAIGMFEAGELSGNLAETMGHVAVSSRLRATTAARTTLRIFGILVYVAMLAYIAYIIITLYAGRLSEVYKSIESLGE
jgi:general secretion pathway protein F